MSAITFIGDELTAAGYRLAGLRVQVVPPAEAAAALRAAREESTLVLLAPAHARAIPGAQLAEALRGFHPLTIAVDDILGQDVPPDLERDMRRALGVELA